MQFTGPKGERAELMLEQHDAVYHAIIRTTAQSVEDAAAFAEAIGDMLSFGRERWFRTLPEGDRHHDFETDTVEYRGYARFSFVLHAGETHFPEPLKDNGIRYMSLPQQNKSLPC